MPKVTSPVIRLILRKEKPLKNGQYPIFLRVSFNGMCERSTGISCDMAHWDADGEKILRGFPNYKSLNDDIIRIRTNAVEESTRQRVNGKGFDIAAICASGCVISDGVGTSSSQKLSALVEAYLESHSLSANTRHSWRNLKNKFVDWFDDDVRRWDIDVFLKRCRENKLSDSTLSTLLGKLHALGLNLKNHDIYRYKVAVRQEHIDKRAMVFLKNRLLSMVADIDYGRGLFTYTDAYIDSFYRKKGLSGSLWALYAYYLLYLTALAPIDLALLKKSQVEVKYIGDNEYFIIKGNRSKTGVPYVISLKRNLENNILIWGLLMFNQGEMLTPICNGLTDKDKMNQRQRNFIQRCTPYLKEHFRRINEDIVQHNVDNKDNVPLIDMACTYYSARHSRATQIFNSPNGTPAILSNFMGRSPSGIQVYIKQLSSDTDLAEMANIVDI